MAAVLSALMVLMIHAADAEVPVDTDSFDEARALVSSGRYLEAVARYQGIVDTTSDPDTRARALFFVGSVYADGLDQADRGLACFNDIVTLYADSRWAPDALFDSGRILYRLDRYDEARRVFQSYVQRYPDAMRRPSAQAWADRSAERLSDRPISSAPPPILNVLSPHLRVLLTRNISRVAVSGPSGWTVKDSLSGRVIERGLGDLAMTLRGGRLVLNGRPIGVTSCLVASDGGTLTVDGQRYRGRIQVLAKPPGLMVVNELSIEDYLYGVVPREMSWLWHPEALMAQAVASRTYALYIRDKQRLAGSDYDLEATTASQVYGGLDAEKEQTRQAVDRTRGRVLTYQGKLIIAYFHATSGGSTESALNVWGVDIPYLKGVSDEFSSLLPDHVWEHRVSLAEMTKLFRSIVPGLGPIRDIRAGKTSPSGRILSFTLVWDGGHKVLPGNLFRLTLGPTLLKSTRFDMVSKNGFVIFKGTGYGHGVGMSQWGAHRMAQAGYSCEAILAHYYTGVSLMQVGYR
jgi:stage II sporulation protein D